MSLMFILSSFASSCIEAYITMRSNKGKSISAIIHQADKRSGIKETVRHLCDIGNQITCLVMFFTGMQDICQLLANKSLIIIWKTPIFHQSLYGPPEWVQRMTDKYHRIKKTIPSDEISDLAIPPDK